MSPRAPALAISAGLLVAITTACGKSSTDPSAGNPPPPPNQQLTLLVTPSVDPTRFRASQEFDLQLVPMDARGNALLSDAWNIDATGSAPSGVSPLFVSQTSVPGGVRPVAAGLSIDYSGSMLSNDPQFLRVSAAESFWTTLFTQPGLNQVALFMFGPPAGTAGFTRTTLLSSWTSDPAALGTALRAAPSPPAASGVLTALDTNTTFLYESLLETIAWIDHGVAAGSADRVLLVITDGLAADRSLQRSAYTAAAQAGIVIHSIGLGPASDQSPQRNLTAVQDLQELAARTGGLYAGAASPTALSGILGTLGRVVTRGHIVAHFKLSAPVTSGAQVRGTVTVSGSRGTVQGGWSFTAP